MTNYGTIPTSSSPPGGHIEYISRAKERIKSGLGTRRPWREMFSFRCLNLPKSFRDSISRVKTNAGYFSMNYAIIALFIIFLSLLWHPISLIVFIVMMAIWTFLYFLRDEPLVIFGRTISDKAVLIVLSIVTLIVLLLTHATWNILVALLIAVVVVLIHAIVRKTDDLYFDEEAGGKDKSVVLWSIHDHISSLAADQGAQKSPGSKGSAVNGKTAVGSTVQPRGIFQGHEDTVEDVQFNPSSAQEFCSVGDDSCLILWDARSGSSPIAKVEKAHNADLHCVHWNPNDLNLILTGSADNTVRMYDRRSLTSGGVGSPIHIFEGHTAAVLCVQWSPAKASVFGSAAEDGMLNIWDHGKVGDAGTEKSDYPPGLFFRHAGHRDKVVDFHWNAADPWTIVSVSEDGEKTGGGGTLQIWRMIDLIYRPEDEVIAELDRFKSHLLSCSS